MANQVDAMEELGRRVTALHVELAEVIDTVADPLLPCLRMTEDIIRETQQIQVLLLAHARHRGQSWKAISRATGMPATTWRDRLTRRTPTREGTT